MCSMITSHNCTLTFFFSLRRRRTPRSTLFPYTTLFRSVRFGKRGIREASNNKQAAGKDDIILLLSLFHRAGTEQRKDRKSTRLNSSHVAISYAVFCLKKKK